MEPQTEACVIAHAIIRVIRKAAYVAAPTPVAAEGRPVAAVGHVPGIGYVRVECRKEWVTRARGEKIRRRYRFFIDGEQRTERALFERARAL